ncbi:MAG: dihydrofolate reductase, partial [Pseudolabrys sp.]|nr:dihydrofolate reductase [Pseudolabrys sp.]
MTLPKEIVGFAIVSEDGMLADAQGVMPPALKFEADQKFFAAGMDRVDAAIHGRHSHEMQPHSPRRKRITLTRQIASIARDPANPKGILWNPGGTSFEQAWRALDLPDGKLGVVGGTDVFTLFLPRYDVFYL